MFSRVYGIAFWVLLLAFAVSAQSVISGRLLKADGKPLAWTEIELVPLTAGKFVDDPRLNTISDARGNFKFTDLPRAKYTLSINFGEEPSELSPYEAFFFPAAAKRDDARVFDLSTATVIDKLVFRLPVAVKFLTVSGTVKRITGVAGDQTFVTVIRSDKRPSDFGLRGVGKLGDFRFSLIAGREYRIVAAQFAETGPNTVPKVIGIAVSEVITLDKAGMKFDLKLIPNPTREQIRLIIGGEDDVSSLRSRVFQFGD